jgi:MFS family permease
MSQKSGELDKAPTASWYALFILFLAYTFSFIDRTILSLLVDPIKAGLGLTDTQVSLLHGLAFALFYTFLGIPIARLADTRSRKYIIASGIVVWSLMTAACGLAGRFATLFLARVGVGVGEAALSPAAFSMLTDLFPKRQLGLAMGLYSMGVYVGAGLAFIVGGIAVQAALELGPITIVYVGEVAPWQLIFIAVGLPGIVVALLMLSVREPKRKAAPSHQDENALWAVFALIAREPGTFLLHFIGFAAIGLIFNGFMAWLPSFFIRNYGLPVGQVGPLLGTLVMVFGSAGIVTGGLFSDRLLRAGHQAGPFISARLAGAALLPLCVAAPLVGSFWLSCGLFAAFFFFSAFPYSSAAAAIQMAAPPHLRAQMSAIYLFVLNLAGIGLGPTVIALITDYGFSDTGKVGQSMAIVGAAAAPIAVMALHFACRPFVRSVEKRSATEQAGAAISSPA